MRLLVNYIFTLKFVFCAKLLFYAEEVVSNITVFRISSNLAAGEKMIGLIK